MKITVDQGIPQALLVSFVMVVGHVFRDGSTQMGFTQGNDSIQALTFYREHKALSVGIQIRTTW